ncbi:DUF2589 domain-containing protein [Acutalibacter sp. JLR.KK004]|uniref:DUF2589 domain-containing protein n=1 Tax=Acutalibacter sp. JLR.KK004 TaxID=3112622 RepID=UPI002FF30115
MGISKWNKKEDHEEGITLSDVIRGLQFCVNSSAEIMEQHHLATMDKYIDPKTQAPLAKRFVIRDGYAIDVPLICLSDHHTLYLDEMDVKLSVRLKDINIKETTAPLNGDGSKFSIDRGSFLVELAGAVPDEDAAVDVNLKFKSTPPPEALARIVEKLDNAITPFEIKGGDRAEKPEKN